MFKSPRRSISSSSPPWPTPLGEVVGLGLRNLANCPVEMNLMPDSTLRWQSFNQKKPYLVANVFSLVLVAFAVGFLFQKLAVNKESEVDRLSPQVSEASNKSEAFRKAYGRLQKTGLEMRQVTALMQQRYYWADFLAEMRLALIRSEAGIEKKLAAQKPGIESGIWIEQLTSESSLGAPSAAAAPMPPGMMNHGGSAGRNRPPGVLLEPGMSSPGSEGGAPPVQAPPPPTNSPVTFICRAVDLTKTSGDPSANSQIAYAVENEIKKSPLVDTKATALAGQITLDEPSGTFTFTVTVMPRNPLNF